MLASEVLMCLRDNEQQLQALGIRSLSIFGSTVRGEATDESDVDLAITFDACCAISIYEVLRIKKHLQSILGVRVDLKEEPVRNSTMQQNINADRLQVY